jgi:hypothetical protein
MNFQISPLKADSFRHLFGQDDEALSNLGVQRFQVDEKPGYPCRISLVDADPGETVLLLNYEHLPVDSPYRSAHAIFVREWAEEARLDVNEVPEQLRHRLISARAFDARGMMIGAEISEGTSIESAIARLFEDPATDFLHLHNAARGCYAAEVRRAA